jgi:hypothetical protein
MACEINASPSNGLVQSADGSGIIKLKSNGVTTNALAWVNFNGTGTVAIRSSYNVSSITDNGTGDYTVNFATALSDANYCAAMDCSSGTAARCATLSANFSATAPTASAMRIIAIDHAGTPSHLTFDPAFAQVAVFGN